MRTLTPDEVNKLLAASKGDCYEALYHIGVMTGARQGEIFALRWCDVDLEAGVISIRHSLAEIYGKDVAEKMNRKAPKNGLVRRVSIPRSTVDVQREHRTKTAPKVIALSAARRDDSLVFFTRGSDGCRAPLRKSNFLKAQFRPLLRRGIDETFHFHGLGHTCASLMLANGEGVAVVAEQLGHDKALLLRKYAHALPAAKHEAVSRLEGMLQQHRVS